MCPYCKIDTDVYMSCEEHTVQSFPDHLFSICPHIKAAKNQIRFLNLGYQNNSYLDMSDLVHFPNAEHFDFQQNNMLKVTGGTMGKDQSYRKIETLILGQNTSLVIDDGAFDGMWALKKLDLEGNHVGSYTSISWPFCHTKNQQKDMQEKANVFYDYSKDNYYTRKNEERYCGRISGSHGMDNVFACT